MPNTTETPTARPAATPRAIHHVRLSVTDVERSKAFYTAVFGLEPAVDNTEQLGDAGAVDDPQRLYAGCVFALGDQLLGLRPVPASAGRTFSPAGPGLDHLSLAVGARADLDAAAERLSSAGVEHGEVIELAEQDMAILSIQDPDDINLELTAPLS